MNLRRQPDDQPPEPPGTETPTDALPAETAGSAPATSGLRTGGALGGLLWNELSHALAAELQLAAGEAIGNYRIVRELGRGGMAVVYLAERADRAYRGYVAVKLLAARVPGADAAARFEQERQILASLDHPHIARLLDGGTGLQGRPYIVMEYVSGQRIDRWCDARQLDVRARLTLFLDVARAVQHAHQHLVVHRDLKPANVLVNDAGQVKLLDFGIAKLLDTRAAGDHAAPATRTTVRVLTPEYASPEQVHGQAITTSSDVYQLGLLLFELLTGQRAQRPADDSLLALERAVVVDEVRRPSAVVVARAADAGPLESAARARGTTPGRLGRELRGDLDNLVSTAVRKEPERRYASAAELAEDVARQLAGRPLNARGDAFLYRAGKFVRRNRLLTAASLLLLITLGAGVGATLWQARAAARAGRTAQEVRAFLLGIFQVADPTENLGRTVTARELLDRGVERIDALDGQEEVQAELLSTAAQIYANLGLYQEAEPLVRRALGLYQRLYGEDSLPVALSRSTLGDVLKRQARFAAAEEQYRLALELRRRLLDPRDELVAANLFQLATAVVERDPAEAEPLLREALELCRRDGRPEGALAGEILNSLGMQRHRAGELDAAEALYRESAEVLRRLGPRGELELVRSLHNQAALFRKRGRLAESERGFREVLAIKERLYPEGHPSMADNWGYLGHVLKDKGDLDGAEAAYRNAVEIHRRLLRPDHPFKASSLDNLGKLILARGRPAEAEPLFRESLAIRGTALGRLHVKTLEAALHLSRSLAGLGRRDEARSLLREVETALGREADVSALHADLGAAREALRSGPQRGS